MTIQAANVVACVVVQNMVHETNSEHCIALSIAICAAENDHCIIR